jgi:hypothetical protein
MPFKPHSTPDDYPELNRPRRPWDEWGGQEQADNLREALGGGEVYDWIEQIVGETADRRVI